MSKRLMSTTCHECGTKLPIDANFCGHCGVKIHSQLRTCVSCKHFSLGTCDLPQFMKCLRPVLDKTFYAITGEYCKLDEYCEEERRRINSKPWWFTELFCPLDPIDLYCGPEGRFWEAAEKEEESE